MYFSNLEKTLGYICDALHEFEGTNKRQSVASSWIRGKISKNCILLQESKEDNLMNHYSREILFSSYNFET